VAAREQVRFGADEPLVVADLYGPSIRAPGSGSRPGCRLYGQRSPPVLHR
jgi:hypothetical protein